MKKLLLTTTAVLSLTFGALMNYQPKIDADFDELGVQQELVNHKEKLDNHEDRITNTESDVRVIQEKTATPPATERVVVREVVAPPAEQKETVAKPAAEPTPPPAPAPAPEPHPRTILEVVTWIKISQVDGDENRWCRYRLKEGWKSAYVGKGVCLKVGEILPWHYS